MSDDFMGLHLKDFVIGLQGGISAALATRKLKAVDILIRIIVGGLTANYCGGWIGDRLDLPHDLAVYGAGVAGLAICHVIIWIAESQIRRTPK